MNVPDNLEELISSYYKNNKDSLHKRFYDCENIISGRICHPSIIVISILSDLLNIDNYMEIGVHNGGSMCMLLSSKNNKTNIFGIDLFENMYDINHHLNQEKFVKYQYFKRDNLSIEKTKNNLDIVKTLYDSNSNITMIKGNSYYDDTEEEFKQKLDDKSLDMLFIDGDHTLDGVKNDYERFSKYVKNGGIIIFDDYHHTVIKTYVDDLLDKNPHLKMISKFVSDGTTAIDAVILKM